MLHAKDLLWQAALRFALAIGTFGLIFDIEYSFLLFVGATAYFSLLLGFMLLKHTFDDRQFPRYMGTAGLTRAVINVTALDAELEKNRVQSFCSFDDDLFFLLVAVE